MIGKRNTRLLSTIVTTFLQFIYIYHGFKLALVVSRYLVYQHPPFDPGSEHPFDMTGRYDDYSRVHFNEKFVTRKGSHETKRSSFINLRKYKSISIPMQIARHLKQNVDYRILLFQIRTSLQQQ